MTRVQRHIFIALTAIALAAVACTGVRDRIDALQNQIDSIEKAVARGDALTSFRPIAENGVITAYELVFENAGTVTLSNTKTTSGARIATVSEDAAGVVFTFDDGTSLLIPKYQALMLTLEGDDTSIAAGESITVTYTITGASNADISVLCGNGWRSEITAAQVSGTITITAPDPITEDKVIVFASDGKGRMVAVEMRLTIDDGQGQEEPPAPPVSTTILLPVNSTVHVGREGGEVTVDLYTNVDYSVETDAGWLHFVQTRAVRTDQLVFYAEPNTGRHRSATAIITAGNYSTQIVFEQATGIRTIYVTPDTLHFKDEGGSAVVTITSNTEITIGGGCDWAAIAHQEGNYYLVAVYPNASTESRTVVYTVSGENAADKTLTVTQDGYVLPEPDPDPLPGLPNLVCHIMPCCRANNAGTKFLVNGSWNSAHNYGNIAHVRGILDKIRKAGINTVCIDFTNASQWDDFGEAATHGSTGEFWYQFGPMLENIVQVCNETGMKFFLFIGHTQMVGGLSYWNNIIARKIWEKWAQDPAYAHYGYGDNRPMLVCFIPGRDFAAQMRGATASQRYYLDKFHIGTCQINSPITFTTTDGWGYRNYSQSSDGKVRFACPNGGVPPQDWYRVDAAEWQRRVTWALGATEYAVIGSYDDTCDAIFWGVADVRSSIIDYHKNSSTVDAPYVYYNIVRKSVTGLD